MTTDNVYISQEELNVIQSLFHDLIRQRARACIDKYKVVLPVLSETLLSAGEKWFPIPGMCGGFAYQLVMENNQFKLKTSSWCRVVGGSGQKHEITKDGCVLIEQGFV